MTHTAGPSGGPQSPRHAAARDYAANYKLLLIPLEEKAKRPAFKTGPNHQTLATSNIDTIDGWWGFRDYNIGLPCTPNRIAVIDVDGPLGEQHLAALENEHGPLPTTWMQTSGRADRPSCQYIYRWPNGEMVPTARISEQLEVRAHGAQIVVAPSIHPTGSQYRWLIPPSDLPDGPAELPRWILELLIRSDEPEPPIPPADAPAVEEPEGLRPGDDYNRHPAAIQNTLQLLQKHGWQLAYTRNGVHYLTRPGKNTREGISATLGHPNTGHGFYVFTTATDFEPERRYSPFAVYTYLEHGGNWQTAAQALQQAGYGDQTIDIKLPERHMEIRVPNEIQPAIPHTEGFPIDTYRGSDIISLADEPVTWLLKRIIADGTYGLVGGQQKSLKTELMIAVDLAVLTGTPFLGDARFPVPEPGPVLLYLSEGGIKPYMRRLKRWAQALDIPLPNSLDDYAIGFAGSKMTPTFLDELHKRIETTGAKLVRLDALYGFSGGDVEGSSIFAMGDLLTGFSNICIATGAAGYITHHFNETGRGSELTRFAMAGSAGWVDSWIMILHRTPPNPDKGQFRLGLRIGSRQWGESAWEVDVDLGEFDPDKGTHHDLPQADIRQADWSEVPKWGQPGNKSSDDELSIQAQVYRIVRDEPWITRREIQDRVGGGNAKRAKVRDIIANGIHNGTLLVARKPFQEGDRIVRREVIGTFDAYCPPEVEFDQGDPDERT